MKKPLNRRLSQRLPSFFILGICPRLGARSFHPLLSSNIPLAITFPLPFLDLLLTASPRPSPLASCPSFPSFLLFILHCCFSWCPNPQRRVSSLLPSFYFSRSSPTVFHPIHASSNLLSLQLPGDESHTTPIRPSPWFKIDFVGL